MLMSVLTELVRVTRTPPVLTRTAATRVPVTVVIFWPTMGWHVVSVWECISFLHISLRTHLAAYGFLPAVTLFPSHTLLTISPRVALLFVCMFFVCRCVLKWMLMSVLTELVRVT